MNYVGHIRKRTVKNGHVYQLIAERSNHTGKRERHYKTLKNVTKKAAEKALRQWLSELENNGHASNEDITMAELFSEYDNLFLHKDNKMLSPTTIANYKKILEKDLLDTLGHLSVQQLTVRDIQSYVNSFYNGGERSPKTVHNHFLLLKKILDWAVANGMLIQNPCESKALQLPKKEKPQTAVLEKVDVERIVQAAEGTDMEFLVKLLFATGCRRGEIISITFDDWDSETMTIQIQNNRVRAEKGSVVKKPKMDKVRTIYVGPEMNALIRRQLIQYKENKLYYGPDFQDSRLMVCQPNGACYQPDSISHKWKRFLKANGLPVVGMHICRHAFASLALAEGCDIASISRYLGHAQTSTTLNQYVNVLNDGLEQVAADMDALLFSGQKAQ